MAPRYGGGRAVIPVFRRAAIKARGVKLGDPARPAAGTGAPAAGLVGLRAASTYGRLRPRS